MLEFGCDVFGDYLKHDEIKMLQLGLLMVKNHVIPCYYIVQYHNCSKDFGGELSTWMSEI